jgi:lipopolysaccharide transport system ATP-binding protein
MSNAIEFNGVSKYFRMDRDKPRAFQQLFISLFDRGRRSSKDDDLFWALRDVSFNVKRGESVGLIGTNGAGKSTTLKLISKIIQPSSGLVKVNGRVTALLELGAGFHPDLSGRDNIFLNGAVMGLSRRDVDSKIDQIIEFAEIGEFIDVPVKDYSSGMYARLGFSVAIHLDPDILLVDEVLSVGDAAFQQKCNERMQELRHSGITVLFVSHSLETIANTCSQAVWLDKGCVRMAGDIHKVTDAYYEYSLERSLGRSKHALSNEIRYGSGEARVTHVELLDDHGNPVRQARTHEPLVVRMHYLTQMRIEQPAFGLAFNHLLTETNLSGPNNILSQYTIPFIEDAGWVDYRIPSLSFLPGEYSITTAIYDRQCVHQYDTWLHSARLTVGTGGTPERHGLIAMNGAWSHHNSEREPARDEAQPASMAM